MGKYRYKTDIEFGGDVPTACLEIEISYDVVWGKPASGHFGPPEDYDPGSGHLIENVELLTIDGAVKPWDIAYGYMSSDEAEEMILERVEGMDERLLENAREADEANAPD